MWVCIVNYLGMFYTNVSNGQHSNNMLVRKDMDVSEHERLSTVSVRH